MTEWHELGVLQRVAELVEAEDARKLRLHNSGLTNLVVEFSTRSSISRTIPAGILSLSEHDVTVHVLANKQPPLAVISDRQRPATNMLAPNAATRLTAWDD